MDFSQTTRQNSTQSPRTWFLGLYALSPFLLFTLLLCVAAAVVYLRRRARLDEFRHRLIPLYNWFLTSGLLALVLPALSQDTLVCYFCPLLEKKDPCLNTSSPCQPSQRCSSSRGHYGLVHVLSSQGCMDAELCGSSEILSYKGSEFNVSHTCCCKDECNTPPKTGPNMELLLGLITQQEYSNIRNVLQEEFWDSCANSTQ